MSFTEPKRLKQLERRIRYVELVDPKSRELYYLSEKWKDVKVIHSRMLQILNITWKDTMRPSIYKPMYLIGLQWRPSELHGSSRAAEYDKSHVMPDSYVTREIHAKDTSTLICEWYLAGSLYRSLHAYIDGTQLCMCRNTSFDEPQALKIIDMIQQYLPIKGVLSIMQQYITVSIIIDVSVS